MRSILYIGSLLNGFIVGFILVLNEISLVLSIIASLGAIVITNIAWNSFSSEE